MKKILIKMIVTVKKIFLFLLNIFFNKETKKKKTNTKNNQQYQENLEKKKETFLKNTQESDEEANSQRELFKEFVHKEKAPLINRETIEIEFYKLIEKTFKLKIKDLPKEKKKKLEEYTTKTIIVKMEEKITENKIEKKEELEKVLKEQLKKDIEKKGYHFEALVENPNLYETKENRFFKNEITEKKIIAFIPSETKSEVINLNNDSEEKKEESIKQNPVVEQPLEIEKKQTEILDPLLVEMEIIKEKKDIETKQNTENIEKVRLEEYLNNIEIEKKKEELDTEEILITIPEIKQAMEKKQEQEIPPKVEKEVEIVNEEKKKKIEKEEEKKEKLRNIQIDITKLELENNKVIEKATKEYQKEDFIDKEYEVIERLLEEKIAKLENLLHNPLTNEQKIKITKELDKLKTTKKQIAFHKEKDLEEVRLSLEEIIPLEEINLINQELNKFTDEEELKRKELLFQNVEQKSKLELENIEQILIKESFRKTVRRLEIPLFLSFPFIKNKHFRRLIGGLFIFRSFGFIKNILIGSQDPLETIDLSAIQRGSDALTESISITEKNIASFNELKNATLSKYPQLKEDIEFLNNLNKIEENLYQNYEKILKQDKTVKKYFNKSKVLLRKRKRNFI